MDIRITLQKDQLNSLANLAAFIQELVRDGSSETSCRTCDQRHLTTKIIRLQFHSCIVDCLRRELPFSRLFRLTLNEVRRVVEKRTAPALSFVRITLLNLYMFAVSSRCVGRAWSLVASQCNYIVYSVSQLKCRTAVVVVLNLVSFIHLTHNKKRDTNDQTFSVYSSHKGTCPRFAFKCRVREITKLPTEMYFCQIQKFSIKRNASANHHLRTDVYETWYTKDMATNGRLGKA